MRPSDSNSQIRADHYSAMGHNGGGGGGGGPQQDEMTKTHGEFQYQYQNTPQKLLSDPEEMGLHHNPDFMMTMSPTVQKGRNTLEMHTEDTTVDNSFAPTNYHSHAKISGR